MVRTIIFDLGGVIVPFDFKRGYAKMEGLCQYPAAEIPQRLRSTDLVTRFETGQIEPRAFVAELCRVLELNATYEQFCELWTSIFLPETLIPETFLVDLKGRYRLLLLSNTNAIHFEMIERQYPLVRHFDRHILSYQVGALKPDPLIYEAALRHAACRRKSASSRTTFCLMWRARGSMGSMPSSLPRFRNCRKKCRLEG